MMLKVFRSLPSVLVGLTIITFLFLTSSSVSADDSSYTANVTIAVPVGCTMEGSGMNSHNAAIDSGTYEENIGATTITTYCNDANGFALYAIGYTNDTYGTNTMVGASTNSTIATGTATSGPTSNWAMKINKVTNTNVSYVPANLTIENSFGSYQEVPGIYTKVASYSSTTDTSLGSEIETTYRVFISSAQPADVYIGQVKYVLVHPANASAPVTPLAENLCPANKICYVPNAGDIVGSMDSISSTKITSSATAGVQSAGSNAEYTLIAPNYSRSGYGFAGWSTDFNATNSSTIYGPNETITTGSLSTNGMILYPVWVASTGMLQGWNGCSSLTTAPTATRATLASMTALTDARDNNVYTVARLADGKCWMTENLRIDAENTRGSTNESLAQGYADNTAQGYGKFIGLADPESETWASNNPTANSIYYSGIQSGTASINVGTNDYPAYRIPRYNNTNINRSLTASYNGNSTSTYYQWYGYGNYYNWPASIANTDNNDDEWNTTITTTSLCPVGWRLPEGGDKTKITSSNDNDFWTLIVTNLNGGTNPANYSSNNQPYYTGSTEGALVSNLVRKFPNNFIYSGEWSRYQEGTKSNGRASEGNYRSSTVGDFQLWIKNTAVFPGTDDKSPWVGISVRCMVGT